MVSGQVSELQLRQLEKQLRYTFIKPALLLQALTHRSMGAENNERLEFLGDSILNFTAAAELFQAMPNADEGTLSRYRALLVKGETLTEIADELSLSELLILGEGELKSGGHRRKSTLADSVEAIIGAVYLDSGLDESTALVRRLLASRLGNLPQADELKDPKTRLQERMQKDALELPAYELVATYGKAHEQQFEVSCTIADAKPTKGLGTSRRKAEQSAAAAMLAQLA